MIKSVISKRIFERIIYILIVINLFAMILESEPNLDSKFRVILDYFESISVIIFTIEYIYRSILSYRNTDGYNWSFFGIIDILSILPFYFQSALGFDGRFIRVFRLFRASRILKLGKFNKSFDLLGRGIQNRKRELYLTFFIAFIMLFFSATGIYYLENSVQPESFSSIRESFWWAVASLTGVGFEEIFPVTTGGKIFGTIISLVGVGVVAVPTGIISASFVEIIQDDSRANN